MAVREERLRNASAMRVIGVLGGSSDQATAIYYRLLNSEVNAALGGFNTAEVVINSVNFARIERGVRSGAWEELGTYLGGKVEALERAGAEMVLCVSNTLHRAADAFMARVRIPLVHIVDPTAEAIRAKGLSRVGLLGTKPVMATDFLQRRYRERHGIETMVPDPAAQELVDRIIFDELCRGVTPASSKAAYLAIVDALARRGAQGIILGCTEIPMLIGQPDRPEIPMFDTTALHAKRAVAMALAD
jgi:aspartate racemase